MNSLAASEQALTVAIGQIQKGLLDLGMGVDRAQQERLARYLLLIEKWNQVYNLTAIRDVSKMVSGHLLDCLCTIPHLTGPAILDVGSGAGLPGIPIAIVKPEWDVTVLDSNHKKATFLRQAIADLGLTNAGAVCERIETWGDSKRFDVIISRAFADLGEFVSVASPLLAENGVFAAMKGIYPYEEIERLPAGFMLQQSVALSVPGLAAERHLVLIAKA